MTNLLITILLMASVAFAANEKSDKHSRYTVGPSIQPLVILGEGWSQQFVIVNVSYFQPEPTVGVFQFYRDGAPWRVPLRGRGTVDRVNINLAPGQMIVLETEVSNATQTLGWAHFDLSDDTNQWGIYRAYTVFRKQTPGQPDLMTSVPFAEDLEDEWIVPFDNEDGKYPGIGIVNSSSSSSTNFLIEVFDVNGNRVKSFNKVVARRSLSWFSLVGEHPELAGRRGQLRISGGFVQSAVFTLQFAGNGAFTALPVVQTFGMK